MKMFWASLMSGIIAGVVVALVLHKFGVNN
jgi:hypothetical protein